MKELTDKIKRDEQSIAELKVGDRVLRRTSLGVVIETVTKLSDASIWVNQRSYWRKSTSMHRKPGGRLVRVHTAGLGSPGMCGGYGSLLRAATEEECAEWGRKVEADKAKQQQEHEAMLAHSALKEELGFAAAKELSYTGGLKKTVVVRDTEFGEKGTFDVVLSGLTEKQVRSIVVTDKME